MTVNTTGLHNSLAYRPEIDGLRAIAVLAVILYHAKFQIDGWRVLPGGYLGVDIFFVISGYLITGILLRDLKNGCLSISGFYERRIRRILPALCFVLLATLPFAWLVLLPYNLIEFSQSLVATNFFVSNIYFWTQDPYTAAPSLVKPLLHTWSLAVEEQFYLFFPIALVWFWRKAKKRLIWVLGFFLLASLVFADWSSRVYPGASFFLAPQRLWELLAGGMLAASELNSGETTAGRGLPTLGLGLIIFGLITFDDQTVHPSLWTVIPVVGTVLLLRYPGRDPWISALLRSRIAIAIGLISYSLYLWHQPVFAFARISSPSPLTPDQKLILLGTCVVAAYFSWKFIEIPCRQRDTLRLKTLASVLICIFIGFLTFAIAVSKSDGFMDRFPPIVQEMIESNSRELQLAQDGIPCAQRKISEACRFSSGQAGETWFIVGDSNSIRLAQPLWERLQERGAVFIPFIANGCYYAPTLLTMNDGWVQCRKEVNLQRRTELLKAPPATIVLFGQLPLYYSGHFQDPYLARVTLQPEIGGQDEVQRKAHIRQVVDNSIIELLEHGHRVLLVYPTPEVGYNVPQRLGIIGRTNPAAMESLKITIPYTKFRETTRMVYEILDSIGEHPNLTRIYPEKFLCPRGSESDCLIVDHEVRYYNDSYHLSYFGANLLAEEILRATPDRWPGSAEKSSAETPLSGEVDL